MNITPIQTKKVAQNDSLIDIIDTSLPEIAENTVIAITSKIISITEGSVVTHDAKITKDSLIKDEADLFIRRSTATYDVSLTVTRNTLIANAGIDESNGNGSYILWPRDPMRSAGIIWEHVRKKHSLSKLGILITDSTIAPLRWGTRGIGIAWCGFQPLNNYIGKPDIFGRPLHYTQASMVDGLAATAVLAMGEGAEQTPIVVIKNIPHISFQDQPPTQEEVSALSIKLEDDLYAPLLTSIPWQTRTHMRKRT